jgi:pimeloyl-ACP methyl ester carboxylesterase
MADATILLIPGLLCDETEWRPLLAELKGEAVVADLSTQDDLTQMARDCLANVPGPLRVAAHSMGARVAMEMARLAPERIERLVLLDTGIHPRREGEREQREEIVGFARKNGMAALAERWLAGMVYEKNRINTTLMKSLTEMVVSKDPDLHERQIRALVNRPDASGYLDQIRCPVLLVVGRQDQWSPVSQHEDMLRLLPDARLEIIENAGHFSLVEQGEKVARIVAKFLTAQQV